jgi:hypothetical protein
MGRGPSLFKSTLIKSANFRIDLIEDLFSQVYPIRERVNNHVKWR